MVSRKIRPLTLIFDHLMLFQILEDPFFWEMCPEFESFRELAEQEHAKSVFSRSALSLKTSPLLLAWYEMLRIGQQEQSDAYRSFVRYVQWRRRRTDEDIVMNVPNCKPGRIVLYRGDS